LKNKIEPIQYIKPPKPANKSTKKPEKSYFITSCILFC